MTLSKKTFVSALVFFTSMLVVFFVFQQTSFAQSVEKGSLVFSPEYPSPGENVTVKLDAYSVDFDTALVTWKVNGEVVQQSYSEKTYIFKAGPAGTKYTVSVSVKDGEGRTVFKEASVVVSDINIVWEGRTYTPPFYKGRALYSPGAEIAIQVLPTITKSNGTLYATDELSYAWFVNDSNVASERGKGKHSVVLLGTNPQQPLKIYLEIKDPAGKVRASRKFVIPTSQPTLMLYESSPYVGVRYDVAIGTILSVYNTGDEASNMSIVAEPYFMSAGRRDDATLEYDWRIGDSKKDSAGTLTLGSEGSGTGSTNLSVTIDSRDYWLQSVRKDITVQYGSISNWALQSSNTEAL